VNPRRPAVGNSKRRRPITVQNEGARVQAKLQCVGKKQAHTHSPDSVFCEVKLISVWTDENGENASWSKAAPLGQATLGSPTLMQVLLSQFFASTGEVAQRREQIARPPDVSGGRALFVAGAERANAPTARSTARQAR
jgi:hypothetical protein